MKKIKKHFEKRIWMYEVIFYFIISNFMKNNYEGSYYIFPLVLAVTLILLNLYYMFNVFKSKQVILYDWQNARGQAFQGGQGCGKTSFMYYCCSVLRKIKKARVYSNAPVMFAGQMCYQLTNDILNLKLKVAERSVLAFQEITTYFHNLDKLDHRSVEYLLQFIRQFFNGHFACDSVVIDERLPKQIREKLTLYKELVGRREIPNSFLFAPLLKIIFACFGKKFNAGIVIWTYYKYRPVNQENYYVDISRSETKKNSKKDDFSGLYRNFAYKATLDYTYDDRFLKPLYTQIEKQSDVQFEEFVFTPKALMETGYKALIEYFEIILKNNITVCSEAEASAFLIFGFLSSREKITSEVFKNEI